MKVDVLLLAREGGVQFLSANLSLLITLCIQPPSHYNLHETANHGYSWTNFKTREERCTPLWTAQFSKCVPCNSEYV